MQLHFANQPTCSYLHDPQMKQLSHKLSIFYSLANVVRKQYNVPDGLESHVGIADIFSACYNSCYRSLCLNKL